MIYAVVFLFGGVLMLAWWLFKMEVASGHFISRREWAEERCKDLEQASRNRKQGLDELARALGYEWKRTEAKEGWERCAVASVKPDAPKKPAEVPVSAYRERLREEQNAFNRAVLDLLQPASSVKKRKPRRATH